MSDTLWPGRKLLVNQELVSRDGNFRLVMQSDGNLVEYRSDGNVPFSSDTCGRSVAHAIMQTDGNFVIYSPGGEAIWATNTPGHRGAYLVLQNDGNIVIYWPTKEVLWANRPD
jgi:hypothetical protein